MGGLLTELGAKLTERWVTALALPGALYLAVAAAAYLLGWDRAWDVGHLVAEITRWAEDPRVDTFGGQAVVFAAVFAGSSAVGLLAQGAGRLVENLWTAADWHRWPPPLRGWTGRWVESRRRRWDLRRREVERARAADGRDGEAAFASAYDRMARLSPERPERPTWTGDRIGAVRTRLDRDHDADLAVLWPHLWLVLPEEARLEVTEARDALSRATGLAAWALLYLPLAVWWYPAVLVCAAVAALARGRTRAATETYATLVEASVRLHAVDLADRVGVRHEGRFDRGLGERLTLRLRASMPPPPGEGSTPAAAADGPGPDGAAP
ncbi:hypothetical protein ACFWTE_18805 [Nocardiopsis sp. NPDC058631]|uniref:hypothetical protein n=1 Tax=Nocardiopsis sp. NPDC058631 TaxID=3346566 RepID=UPI003660D674